MSTKILVIDDDVAITELMGMLLRTHGFEVITTNFGTEGIRLTAEKMPDVVLLDLMMPDQDGWQVCKSIRVFSNTPILILSAVNDPSIVASVLESDSQVQKGTAREHALSMCFVGRQWTTRLAPGSPARSRIQPFPRRTPGSALGLGGTAAPSLALVSLPRAAEPPLESARALGTPRCNSG